MGQTVGNAARRWLNVMVVVLCPPLWLYAGYKLTRHPIDIHGRGFLDCVTMLIFVPLSYWGALKEWRKREHNQR